MDLREAKKFYALQLEEKVDDFIEEHGYEYVVPSPLESSETQVKRLRNEMLNKLTYKEYDIKKGLQLVLEYLPKRLSVEEWKKVLDELRSVEENALEYFNSEVSKDPNSPILPTYKFFGLSLETYRHCKELLYDFLRQDDFQHVQDLSFFLLSLFQNKKVPWLGVARSYDHFREYGRAIEIYKKVHEMFPSDPLSYIFCSLSHIMLKEFSEAKTQIEKAEELIENEPEMKEAWSSVVNDIKGFIPN